MSAGIPNYQQLYQMGRLPKEGRKFIPGLMEYDAMMDSIKGKLCPSCREKIFHEKAEEFVPVSYMIPSDTTTGITTTECSFPHCDFIAKNEQGLKIHQAKHK